MKEAVHTMTTRPSELGEVAAGGVTELLRRGTRGAPVATYAESESPISWATIASGGWDGFGIVADGEGATLRDLVELARSWGGGCVQQPLLTSVLTKRHSAAAAAHDGPVTLALPLPGGANPYVPFGQVPSIVLATSLGGVDDKLVPVPDGVSEKFGIVGRGVQVPVRTTMPAVVAREVAVVLAAEATGAAERLLQESLVFVHERKQFGKPIGSFQAIKHRLANAAMDTELAETAVIWAAERSDEAFRGARFAVDRSIDVAEAAIQAHGGLGFTWEVGLHFLLRQMILARDMVCALEFEHG